MSSDRPPLVRRLKNTSLEMKYLRPSYKFALSIMIWASISHDGKSQLYIVESTMKHDQYIRVLESHLVPFINKYHSPRPALFQDDNAPAHRHKNVSKWIVDNGIETLFQPAQSPDLNPIENLWDYLKKKISKHHPRNIKELKEITKLVWDKDIPHELVQNLCKSIRRRAEKLILAGGKHIDY